jgi:hypothetical protein
MEINACFLPPPLHRAFRHVPHGNDFPESEPDFGECRLRFAKLVQRFADLDQLAVVRRVLHRVSVERSNLEKAAAFLGVPFPLLASRVPSWPSQDRE